MCNFVEILNTPNQQINVAIPWLVKYLDHHLESVSTVHLAANSLKNIIAKGMDEQRKMIVDGGAIIMLIYLLESSSDNSIMMNTAQALAKLVPEGSDQNFESVVVNGVIFVGLACIMKSPV